MELANPTLTVTTKYGTLHMIVDDEASFRFFSEKDEQYFKGTTPLTINGVSYTGSFNVAIEANQHSLRKGELRITHCYMTRTDWMSRGYNQSEITPKAKQALETEILSVIKKIEGLFLLEVEARVTNAKRREASLQKDIEELQKNREALKQKLITEQEFIDATAEWLNRQTR